MTPSPSSGPSPTPALLALGLAMVMLAQDLAALNVALPSIERNLQIDLSTAQWVVNAYLLVYGMTIVTGGRLADMFGRRRVFLAGAAIFALMSTVAGIVPNAAGLIVARALMGIGAGLMLPAVTGMGYAVLPKARAALAGGLIVAAYGLGMALGPTSGGGLTEFLGWRWIQYINLPIAVLVMLGVWRTIPHEPGVPGTAIDYAGIAALSAGLFVLLFALDQASAWGWGDWRILLGLGLAALCLLVFVVVERRAGEAALIPGDLLRTRRVAVACVLRALMGPAYAAVVLYLPQLMQKLLGYSPLQSGLGMLPLLGTYAIVSLLVGLAASRLPNRIAIIAGLAGLAIGPLLLSRFGVDSGYGALVAGMVVTGIGLGLFQPADTTEAVQGDARDRKSLAGGLVLMFQFVGGAIGLGLTTTIVASSERGAVNAHLANEGIALPGDQRAALDGLLAGTESARQVLQQFDAAAADRLLALAAEAFAAGVSAGLRLDAGLAAVGLVLAVLFARRG